MPQGTYGAKSARSTRLCCLYIPRNMWPLAAGCLPPWHVAALKFNATAQESLKKPPTLGYYNSGTIWALYLTKVPKSICGSSWIHLDQQESSYGWRQHSNLSLKSEGLLYGCLGKSSEWARKLGVEPKSLPTATAVQTHQSIASISPAPIIVQLESSRKQWRNTSLGVSEWNDAQISVSCAVCWFTTIKVYQI